MHAGLAKGVAEGVAKGRLQGAVAVGALAGVVALGLSGGRAEKLRKWVARDRAREVVLRPEGGAGDASST